MKIFLYIRGYPGTGKITVARLLQKKLGWRLFWFHDLKNAVYNIVHEHHITDLVNVITVPVVEYLLKKGENIIYVRPSPEKESVESIHKAVQLYPEYKFCIVRLEADYDTLHSRVISRHDPYRITTKETLDEYLLRPMINMDGEYLIPTDNITSDEVAKKIEEVVSEM